VTGDWLFVTGNLETILKFVKIVPALRRRHAFGSRVTGHGSRFSGFTLIELMVVLAIIALLVSVVAPSYGGRIKKTEETVLREDLKIMREALDTYFADTGQYPDTLQDLVSKRYLRNVPSDPVTQSATTWIVVAPADSAKGGVYDVRSGAKGTGSDGKSYAEW
jgi:general secretion pathway protein G